MKRSPPPLPPLSSRDSIKSPPRPPPPSPPPPPRPLLNSVGGENSLNDEGCFGSGSGGDCVDSLLSVENEDLKFFNRKLKEDLSGLNSLLDATIAENRKYEARNKELVEKVSAHQNAVLNMEKLNKSYENNLHHLKEHYNEELDKIKNRPDWRKEQYDIEYIRLQTEYTELKAHFDQEEASNMLQIKTLNDNWEYKFIKKEEKYNLLKKNNDELQNQIDRLNKELLESKIKNEKNDQKIKLHENTIDQTLKKSEDSSKVSNDVITSLKTELKKVKSDTFADCQKMYKFSIRDQVFIQTICRLCQDADPKKLSLDLTTMEVGKYCHDLNSNFHVITKLRNELKDKDFLIKSLQEEQRLLENEVVNMLVESKDPTSFIDNLECQIRKHRNLLERDKGECKLLENLLFEKTTERFENNFPVAIYHVRKDYFFSKVLDDIKSIQLRFAYNTEYKLLANY